MYKLLKLLYSLKQSFYLWYKRHSTFFLEQFGLKQTYADHSIFITDTSLKKLIMSMFVDDIQIIGLKRNRFIKKIKKELIAAFSIIDMDLISFYLGLKVD